MCNCSFSSPAGGATHYCTIQCGRCRRNGGVGGGGANTAEERLAHIELKMDAMTEVLRSIAKNTQQTARSAGNIGHWNRDGRLGGQG